MVTKVEIPIRENLQRARQPEEKAHRRQQILLAASGMLDMERQGLPSVADIAEAAGVAKGSVYNYFKTKEEVYLALLAEGFGRWITSIRAVIDQPEPDVDTVLQAYIQFCSSEPKIMRLACLAPAVLEENISYELAYEFKKHLAAETRAVANRLTELFPMLTVDSAIHLFLSSYALTLGIWQLAYPAKVIREVTTQEDTRILRPDFQASLYSALLHLWQGTIIVMEEYHE